MSSFTMVTGRLGGKPETIKTKKGTLLTKFSVADNARIKKAEGYEQVTFWHDVVTSGKLGEVCVKYLDKGSLVQVQGLPRPSSYEKDGNKHKSYSVFASSIEFLDTKKGTNPKVQADNDDGLEDISFEDDILAEQVLADLGGAFA